MFYARKKDITLNLKYSCWRKVCEARELVERYVLILVLSLVGNSELHFV